MAKRGKREADVLTRGAQMIPRTRQRVSARSDFPSLVSEMERKKLPFDSARPGNFHEHKYRPGVQVCVWVEMRDGRSELRAEG
jgi:hypothetical protein